MWDYLYFVMHLNHKDPTEYTGAESFVSNCIGEEDIGWVPQGRAMELVQKEVEDDITEATFDANTVMAQKIDALADVTESNFKRLQQKILENDERQLSAQSASTAQLATIQGQVSAALAKKKK